MKNKIFITGAVIICAGIGVFFLLNAQQSKKSSKTVIREVKPVYGNIQNVITATGTVQPQNRLEIKPAINGRIESILVNEGDTVKKGQTVAFMSSMDRAALLDAAVGQGADTEKYWSEVYKQVPMTAPIDGEVIVRAVEPGQTVTTAAAVIVLSDRLIVYAQVDETDIGKVKVGQAVTITLDAYPSVEIKGKVDHIAYESKLVNNVTIYDVEILVDKVPDFFRSGMSANVAIVEKSRENVLLIPNEALIRQNGDVYVRLASAQAGQSEVKKVTLGMSDDNHSEIASGLNLNDTVVIESKAFSLPKNNTGKNPFMPGRR